VPDVPHVALVDEYYAYDDKYIVRGAYTDPMSEAVRRDRDGIMRAGGYRIEEAWERALRCAVAGLDIMPLSGIPEPSSEGKPLQSMDAAGDVIMASV
jgi:CDK-activating kinase assembly factor MAT1